MKTPEELVYAYKNMDTKSKEPALKEGAIITLIYAVGALIAVFLPRTVTENTTFQIIGGLCAFIIPLGLSFIIRGRVWPPASVAVLINQLESMKAQQNHPIDNLTRDFFSGEVKHNHASYIVCAEHCPRHPDHKVNEAPEL